MPVLDMYHHGLMNPCIPAIKALRMPDGAHMTLEGLELYTAQIIGFCGRWVRWGVDRRRVCGRKIEWNAEWKNRGMSMETGRAWYLKTV